MSDCGNLSNFKPIRRILQLADCALHQSFEPLVRFEFLNIVRPSHLFSKCSEDVCEVNCIYVIDFVVEKVQQSWHIPLILQFGDSA